MSTISGSTRPVSVPSGLGSRETSTNRPASSREVNRGGKASYGARWLTYLTRENPVVVEARRCRHWLCPRRPQWEASDAELRRSVTPELEAAVSCIQRCARKFLNSRFQLHRRNLIARLELERTFLHGIRLGTLCLALFIVMLINAYIPQSPDIHLELGLLQTYRAMFHLDNLGDIRTVSDINKWLKSASVASRRAQVTSSDYLIETVEQRIMNGVYTFNELTAVSAPELQTGIMAKGFTFTVWVNPPGTVKAEPNLHTIVRKPIEGALPSLSGSPLSCWSWYVNFSNTFLKYGAHDNPSDQAGEEVHWLGAVDELWNTSYFLALVVEGNLTTYEQTAFLYANGKLIHDQTLPRPVTDCDGLELYMGGSAMSMADLTYYPRALSAAEVRDALNYGLPLSSLLRGKISSSRTEDTLSRALSAKEKSLDVLLQGQRSIETGQAQEELLTRAALSALGARGLEATRAVVPELPIVPKRQLGEFAVRLWDHQSSDDALDPITGHSYTDLFPGRFANFTDGGRFSVPDFPMHLRTLQFPKDFTLSMWVKPDFGYMVDSVFFYAYNMQDGLCWLLTWHGPYNTVVWGVGQQDDWPVGAIQLNSSGLVRGEQLLRHLVFRQETYQDPDDPTIEWANWSIYLDGDLMDTMWKQPPQDYECEQLIFPGTLGDPFLGSEPHAGFMGEMQQVRLYPTSLSAEEIHSLHQLSVDPDTGENLRACLDNTDETFADSSGSVDSAGHDCAWYYEARQQTPELCDVEAIRKSCPIACGIRKACWYMRALIKEPWEQSSLRRLMKLESETSLPTVCASQDALETYGEQCFALATSLETCRYSDPWYSKLAEDVNESDKWTLSVWIRILEGGLYEIAPLLSPGLLGTVVQFANYETCNRTMVLTIMPEIDELFMQILVPGEVSDPAERDVFTVRTKVHPGTFDIGNWVMITASVTTLVPPEDPTIALPQRYLWVFVNGMPIRNPTSEPATIREGRYGFGVMPNGFSVAGAVMIGPVVFSAQHMPPWAVQSTFYEVFPTMRARVGTAQTLNVMGRQEVEYQTKPFRIPGFLIAPPLILQRRRIRTLQCSSSSGSQAIGHIRLLAGAQCNAEPYTCPAANSSMSSADYLHFAPSCKAEEMDAEHFGRQLADMVGGEEKVFGEFLLTATDASFVARKGQVYDTSDLIDAQSEWVRVMLVLVAPDFQGRVTTVQVTFSINARVKATFSVDHFRAIEPGTSTSRDMEIIAAVLSFLAVCLLVDALVRMSWSCSRGNRRRKRCAWPKKIVLFDIAFAVAIKIVCWAQFYFVSRSKDILAGHLERLMDDGRWTIEEDESLAGRLASFIKDNADLARDISWKAAGQTGGMVIAFLALGRLIVASQTHPRIAILMDTLSKGFDPLVHFFMLLALFFCSFVLLGVLFFGNSHEEFGSRSQATELLVTLMTTGEYPEGTFKEDWGYIVFIIMNLVIFFFLMLNFALAIIVNMYAKVQTSLDELEVEEFVFLDMFHTLFAAFWRWWYRWPPSKDLVQALREEAVLHSCTVDSLGAMIRGWDRRSRVRFVQYYRQHKYLEPQPHSPSDVEKLALEVESRIALLLGRPPASEYELAMARAQQRREVKRAAFPWPDKFHVPTDLAPHPLSPLSTPSPEGTRNPSRRSSEGTTELAREAEPVAT